MATDRKMKVTVSSSGGHLRYRDSNPSKQEKKHVKKSKEIQPRGTEAFKKKKNK